MKLVKMSMVAALLLGANVYALDNVKVNGDAKLYYHTDDSTNAANDGGLFDQQSSAGQVALNLGVTADLTEGVSAGVTMTALSTLGLQNNLVNNVWEAQASLNGGDYWFSEAWMATTMGNTTAKVGRQALDTPLLFTETWSIAQNTFDAIALINQDLPDTTLVGAYVGSHNSGYAATTALNGVVAAPQWWNGDTRYGNAGVQGAFAFGAINNSMKELTLQAWYYDVQSLATALWLSGDLAMDGILAGIQYSQVDESTNVAGNTDNDITAVMLGYEMKDVATFKVAYSMTGDNALATPILNAGGNIAGSGQSKVYTEMWWNYGKVTANDTDALLVSAETKVSDIDLFASYVAADHGNKSTVAAGKTDTEVTVTASKSYGPVDTTVAYIYSTQSIGSGVANTPAANDDPANNSLQVYLTYNF